MAIMFPKNINEYMPTYSERLVYEQLKEQLPDSYTVFYSIEWSRNKNGRMEKSEADFVVTHPEYGYVCLEVKGGRSLVVKDGEWFIEDNSGIRRLRRSPYIQAEESMYFFKDAYRESANISFNGIAAGGVVFPLFNVGTIASSISNRQAECTIDAIKIQNLQSVIKAIFKTWGGARFGVNIYTKSEHEALMNMFKKRVAISAAAGALIKYTELQLDVINRVQDNYIQFISNYNQFYVNGGAGTGKTWIAMKMAKKESEKGKSVLVTCCSKKLADFIRQSIPKTIDVVDIESLLSKIINNYDLLDKDTYIGALSNMKKDVPKYDAIFIDEAQDLDEEVACVIRLLLRDEKKSILGVFYDDVQKIKDDNFGNAFLIDSPPFLLKENIRNTANIYRYAMENTNLGTDVIRNPVEGPNPTKEKIIDKKHLTQRLENLLKEFIVDEHLSNKSIVILFDDIHKAKDYIENGIAQWKFTFDQPKKENEVQISSAFDYKGLEANFVIYIHDANSSKSINYIAYTRAKYYLYELVTRDSHLF